MRNEAFKQNLLRTAEVIVPSLRKKPELQKDFLANFEKLFTGLDKEAAGKVALLIKLISYLSIFYNLSTYDKLSYSKRQKYIDKLFRFPIPKIVSGMTGLRSLILIAYYGIESVWPEIHYDGPLVSK